MAAPPSTPSQDTPETRQTPAEPSVAALSLDDSLPSANPANALPTSTPSLTPSKASSYKVAIAGGVPFRVFGLDALPKASKAGIAVLYLLHGREQTQAKCEETAIEGCRESAARQDQNALPLICVTLDARNHGERTVDVVRNKNFRNEKGELVNPTHAVDMVTIITGTANDVSLLLDFLPAVLFPTGEHTIVRSALAGISLGGHTTWTAAARDIRLAHLSPILSSPSMRTLLTHRQAPFPSSLGTVLRHTDADQLPLDFWTDRNILVLGGADDTLVPFYEGGCEAFVEQLRTVADVEVYLQPKTGHVYTQEMKRKLLEWLAKTVCIAE